jgi:flagellar motor switch protein FliG
VRGRNISPHRYLLDLIRISDQVEVQNRLMSAPDKEIALSMLYMSGFERDQLLRRLSERKRRRVQEELKRQEHVRILYDQYERAVQWLTNHISSSRRPERARSYFRPTRRSGGGRA